MTTMKKSIHDNANGLDYTLVNDHYLPNLTAAAPDRKSTRLNSSHANESRMPSSA